VTNPRCWTERAASAGVGVGSIVMIWEYAMWGCFGGFAVEGLEFSGAIRRVGGWPWHQSGEPGPLPLAVSVVIRLLIGAGLAVAAGTTGQVSGPFGALAVGIAAPLLIEQLGRQIPGTISTGATAALPKASRHGSASSRADENAPEGSVGQNPRGEG
jgi:hypothetical protein